MMKEKKYNTPLCLSFFFLLCCHPLTSLYPVRHFMPPRMCFLCPIVLYLRGAVTHPRTSRAHPRRTPSGGMRTKNGERCGEVWIAGRSCINQHRPSSHADDGSVIETFCGARPYVYMYSICTGMLYIQRASHRTLRCFLNHVWLVGYHVYTLDVRVGPFLISVAEISPHALTPV